MHSSLCSCRSFIAALVLEELVLLLLWTPCCRESQQRKLSMCLGMWRPCGVIGTSWFKSRRNMFSYMKRYWRLSTLDILKCRQWSSELTLRTSWKSVQTLVSKSLYSIDFETQEIYLCAQLWSIGKFWKPNCNNLNDSIDLSWFSVIIVFPPR